MAERNTGCSYTGLCNFSRSHAARMWELRGVSPPDWVASPDRARPWLPWAAQTHAQPGPCLLPLPVLGTFSTVDRACTSTAPLPAFPPSPAAPDCLGKGFIREAAFVLRVQLLFPRCQCRLAGPLPCPLAQRCSRSAHCC